MKKKEIQSTKKGAIEPFKIAKAMAGMELSKTDNYILSYLSFITKNIPTKLASFVHVKPNFDNFNNALPEEFAEMKVESLIEEEKEELQKKVEKYFSKEENCDFKIHIKEGSALDVLLDCSDKLNADLVVIGQRKGTKHHGILAKKFAREVKGNALIIPEKSKPAIKKILVPIDFSENSARALQAAVAINKQLAKPAKLIVLNVYQLPNLSSYRILRSRSKFKAYVEENKKDALEKFLDKYVPAEKESIQTELLFKNTAQMAGYIYSFAAKNKIDFMVVGAKGHTRIKRLLMGSVTERLLSLNQTFPTMVVK